MILDVLSELKFEANKAKIVKVYEQYVQEPLKFENVFWTTVLEFAKTKLYYLELEFSKIGTSNTMDDYSQEIALAVWTGLPSFKGNGLTFYAWLHSICYKHAADFFKELKHQKDNKVSVTLTVEDEDGKEELVDNPVLHNSEIRDSFVTIPNSVQGVDRNICKLIVSGMNYREIAEELLMSENSVKLRIRKLRTNFEAERKIVKNARKTRARKQKAKQRPTSL